MSLRSLLTLHTTMPEFEDTHARADKVRSTTKSVSVDRDALMHLLMDHSGMLQALRDGGRVDVRES